MMGCEKCRVLGPVSRWVRCVCAGSGRCVGKWAQRPLWTQGNADASIVKQAQTNRSCCCALLCSTCCRLSRVSPVACDDRTFYVTAKCMSHTRKTPRGGNGSVVRHEEISAAVLQQQNVGGVHVGCVKRYVHVQNRV